MRADATLMALLLDAFTEAGGAESPGGARAPDGVMPGPAAEPVRHLASHRQWAPGLLPRRTRRRVLTLWTRLHGVISLEVAATSPA